MSGHRANSRRFVAALLAALALSPAYGADGPLPPFSYDGRVPLNRIARVCDDVLRLLWLKWPARMPATTEEALQARGIDVGQLVFFGEGGQGTVSYGGVVLRDGTRKIVVVKSARSGNESSRRSIELEHDRMKTIGLMSSTLVRARDGSLILVMDAVVDPAAPNTLAPNLAQQLPRDSRFAPQAEYRDPAYIRKTALEILDDLIKVNDAGLVHADVKPANVALGEKARLVDLGVAQKPGHKNERGRLTGTPSYMDTEAMKNLPWTFRRDVHAAQKVLQEMYWQSKFMAMRIGDQTGFIRREFHAMAYWHELGMTPEDGGGGVSPQVAWVLTTNSFANARELREWLVTAESSKSMPEFLKKFAEHWENAWQDAEKEPEFAVRRQRLQDLTDDLARKPVFGPALVRQLSPATRKSVLAEAVAFRDQNRTFPLRYPAYGYHREIDPQWLAQLPP